MPGETLLEVWAQYLETARSNVQVMLTAQQRDLQAFLKSGEDLNSVTEPMNNMTWREVLDFGETQINDAQRMLQTAQKAAGQGLNAIQQLLEDGASWPPNPTVYDPADVIPSVQPAIQTVTETAQGTLKIVQAGTSEAGALGGNTLVNVAPEIGSTVDALAPEIVATAEAAGPQVAATLEASAPQIVATAEAAGPQIAATIEQNAPTIVPVVVAGAGAVAETVVNPTRNPLKGPLILTVILAIPVVLATWWLTKPNDPPAKPKVVATATDKSDATDATDSSKSDVSDSDPSSSRGGGTASSSSDVAAGNISGRFVLTEDKTQFSPGAPDAADPLGCANRRVPDAIDFTLIGTERINLSFPEEPGLSASDHDGTINGQLEYVVEYPDASGKEIEGKFEISGSESNIVDGRMFSGDCTFFYTGHKG